MLHRPVLLAERRELEPRDGWARSEPTGRATTVCACGLNTGFIDTAEAAATFAEHPKPPEPVTVEPDTPQPNLLQVDIRLVGLGSDVKDFVRRLIRRNAG